PVAPEWRQAMDAAGVKVQFWCPRFGVCVALPEGMDAAGLRSSLPFAVGAQPYTEELCSRGTLAQSHAVRERSGLPEDLFDLVCFSRDDRERVEQEVARMGIPVLATSSSKIRVHYTGDPAVLREITGVKLVDPARAPVMLQGAAATLQAALGVAAASGEWRSDLTGRGQVVAVADSGLDRGVADGTLHPDFAGRVRFIRSWPINPSWTPFVVLPGADDGPADVNSGHGTHVAGLAVGSGAMSGGVHRGIAPGAELVFQAIEQQVTPRPEFAGQLPPGWYLAGRPLDLRELFREAREQGARIHVNAWGDPAQGRYTDDAYETDLFLQQNPDAVILFAAGNGGADRDADRVPDPRTLYAPASAKSVVAVGASEGVAAGTGGFRGTWGQFDPSGERHRAPADRADSVVGEPDRLALLSSAGPSADGRVKPDVCAPGTSLVAPRSSVCRQTGWGTAAPGYMYNGGTSMAVGVAGGLMALLRQAWQEHQGGTPPSGAALKALCVMGALPLRARSGAGEESRTAAGFGRVHLEGSLPRQPGRVVRLMDDAAGLATGEMREYRLTVRRPGTLRAVLCWYDAPGEVLVNDLDLALSGPSGRVHGNHAAGEGGAPDRRNTVEVVHLSDAAPGEYTLRVLAANAPAGAQPFALAFAYPAPAGIQLPVDALLDLGAAARTRLQTAGVATVGDLAGLDDAQLAERAGVRGHALIALRGRLAVLRRVAATPPAPTVPRAATLASVLDTAAPAPEGVPPDEWRRAAAELAPLALVFDRGRLSGIRLADLFDPVS
ncbi:MAG TPA: S8 family serine peptidase, partial [Longimicrobium sp.]|nr:S8 family serine peptidase [Longimicrobium sp.]